MFPVVRLKASTMRGLLLVGTLAVSLHGGYVAFANEGQLEDPRGDAESHGAPARFYDTGDITRIEHGHTRSGLLFHEIKVDGQFKRSTSVDLTIAARGGEGGPCDYVVAKEQGEYVLVSCNQTRTPVRTVRDGHTLRVILPRRAIGSPSSYEWQVLVTADSGQGLIQDVAPNAGTLRHGLR